MISVFMQNWEDGNDDEYCSIRKIRATRSPLPISSGIDIEIVNFASEQGPGVQVFPRQYSAGRTPNPRRAVCNAEIKFRRFSIITRRSGADCIATWSLRAQAGAGMVGTICRKPWMPARTRVISSIAWSQAPQLSKAIFSARRAAQTEVRKLAEQAHYQLCQEDSWHLLYR